MPAAWPAPQHESPTDRAGAVTAQPSASAPRTLWHVVYGGPQHGVMLRKLERAGGFQAIEPLVERLMWQGRAEANVRFFVAHADASTPDTPSPDALEMAVLKLAWRLAPTWRVTRTPGGLSGEWRAEPDAAAPPTLPGGCWQIRWDCLASQAYQPTALLGGQANGW